MMRPEYLMIDEIRRLLRALDKLLAAGVGDKRARRLIFDALDSIGSVQILLDGKDEAA
jgi:hypothetical protein